MDSQAKCGDLALLYLRISRKAVEEVEKLNSRVLSGLQWAQQVNLIISFCSLAILLYLTILPLASNVEEIKRMATSLIQKLTAES